MNIPFNHVNHGSQLREREREKGDDCMYVKGVREQKETEKIDRPIYKRIKKDLDLRVLRKDFLYNHCIKICGLTLLSPF